MRPDVTVPIERGGTVISALVVECKHSETGTTSSAGPTKRCSTATSTRRSFEARCRPCSSVQVPCRGEVREDHEVVAMSWNAWPSPPVIASLVSALFSGPLHSGVLTSLRFDFGAGAQRSLNLDHGLRTIFREH